MDSQGMGQAMGEMFGCFFVIMGVGAIAVVAWIVYFIVWMCS